MSMFDLMQKTNRAVKRWRFIVRVAIAMNIAMLAATAIAIYLSRP